MISQKKMKPADAYEIMKYTAPTDSEDSKFDISKSDDRFADVKKVIQDLKDVKESKSDTDTHTDRNLSKEWFQAVQDIYKTNKHISDGDIHRIATRYTSKKRYFK